MFPSRACSCSQISLIIHECYELEDRRGHELGRSIRLLGACAQRPSKCQAHLLIVVMGREDAESSHGCMTQLRTLVDEWCCPCSAITDTITRSSKSKRAYSSLNACHQPLPAHILRPTEKVLGLQPHSAEMRSYYYLAAAFRGRQQLLEEGSNFYRMVECSDHNLSPAMFYGLKSMIPRNLKEPGCVDICCSIRRVTI